MFGGFETRRIDTGETEIHTIVGGNGPPLLLLHGYPQTHVIWHRVAPRLAERFTVVAPDLRGYGDSAKPEAGDDHANYTKRAMARDQVAVMAALGFDRFAAACHDRGARVGYRLALDHPDRLSRLALLDITPTVDQFSRATKDFALGSYHWFFLAQPAPFPETLIGARPEFFLRHTLRSWAADAGAFTDEAMAEYLRCFSDPETIRATCDDYRAGAGLDCEYDEADLAAGNKITCPLLVLWGEAGRWGRRGAGGGERGRRILDIWRQWAVDVEGRGLACGHFIPEEAPAETLAALLEFLTA